MMTTLPPDFDLSNDFTYLIFEMAWKSAVILGGVILINKFLKHKPASLRQSIFSASILAIMALLVTAPFFPRWCVFLPPLMPANSFAESANETRAEEPANLSYRSAEDESGIQTDSTIGNRLRAEVENQAAKINFIAAAKRAVFFIWLAGACILLWRLCRSLSGLKHLRHSSGVQINNDLNSLVQNVSSTFGCEPQKITVLKNETAVMPITWGILRHIILLPKDFDELPTRHQRAVLVHEINHIERYDFSVRVLTDILCAVLWFQPLIWIVRRGLQEEQERAADDRVLSTGEKPSTYARLLLEWNERLTSSHQVPIAAGMLERSSLNLRIKAILNPNTARRPAARLEILFIRLAALSLVIPLTGLAFSGEIPPNGQVPPASLNQAESSFLLSDKNSQNKELPLQNGNMSVGTGKITRKRLPARTTFAVTNRSKDVTFAGKIKPKNKANEIKSLSGNSETNLNSALSSKTTNSPEAVKIPPPEKDKKDSAARDSQSPTGKTHQTIRQIFANIRQGFKNGSPAINIFDP